MDVGLQYPSRWVPKAIIHKIMKRVGGDVEN